MLIDRGVRSKILSNPCAPPMWAKMSRGSIQKTSPHPQRIMRPLVYFSNEDLGIYTTARGSQSGDFTEGRAINASSFLLSVLELNDQAPHTYFAKAISEVLD
jgi:hypothetical protein